MIPPAHGYLFLAVFALCGGLLTLSEGHSRGLAVVELLMAIISAVAGLRSRQDE
jgi:hypothetical protein